MPCTVDLVCVPPSEIPKIWPLARQLIKTAIEQTDLSEFADIEKQVLSGEQLLWLAWSGTIEAAATTHLIKTSGKPILIVTACSGSQRERWLSLLDQIETYARNEGCSKSRIYGRKGWQRVLNGYQCEYVILEKGL